MFEIAVREHFDAAHFLRDYQGRCENLHGHRFLVAAHLGAQALNEIGLAYDFVELKGHLRELLARYDHTCLNDVAPFDRVNPSSENIARTLYEDLAARVGAGPVRITAVEVAESPDTWVVYSPDT